MARMEMRTREAPMEWEREQDRNVPNIFSNPQPLAEQTTTPATSNGQHQKPFLFGASVQRGSSFASNQGSFTSDGLGATTPNPFHQDSQLPAGAATFSRQESFSFSSGGGSFSRPQSPNNTAPQGFTGAGATTLHRDGSATTEVMDVDEYPSTRSAKTGGSELFDMGSLRNGVVAEQQGLSPRRMLGETRSSSSSAMVGSRTSSMQYRGSGGAGRGSKFWSDDDDEDNDEDMNDPEGDSEDDNYGRRGSGRQPNRHMVAMNSAFVGMVIYIIYNFITTIQNDVTIRAEGALARELQIIKKCKQDYYDNKCHLPHGRLLELPCQEFLECSTKTVPRIERSAVAAQTFALIFNSFVHTISYKTMFQEPYTSAPWVST
ncbi:hypothetical protein K457DRAFT_120706 [Linnemannia elongata AG-77]|uniref:Brl1/Brr6 domain-containing protein n=1 Tax=Linnemannia elongata AG-77 TaxID=1314771 RepID=A0A197KEM3_9FUNG|nr:hypothetical protein K457DRAFT_120706 [Linnemannia elongata AG-77]